jgi:predicted MPP superfamily phosphohydrolase
MATGFGQYLYNIVTSFDDPTSTRSFAWTANQNFLGDETLAIKYRVKGETAWTTVNGVKKVEKTNIPTEDYYEADIKGLKADTEYEYKIGIRTSSDEQNDWTRTYTFKTAAKNIKDFSFVAFGDTQSLGWGGDEQNNKGYKYAMVALEEAMQEVPDAAFILNAGDVTDRGDNLQYWNWYFKSLGHYGPTVPHFATQGNHDTWVGDQNNYFSLHFNHPNNGSNALDSSISSGVTTNYGSVLVNYYDDTVYSYNYGEAHFIVLNSGPYNSDDMHVLKAQRTWLENDLEANADARWTIIMVHEAVYHRLGAHESRPWLYDTIEKYGVDLVIQGHSHLVTRTYPMKNGQIVTKESVDVIPQGTGTIYTTIGSTTLNHDTIGNPNVEECMTILTPHNLQPSYTVVSVKEDKLVMTVKQVNGYVLDEFTITADPNYVAPAPDDDNNGGDNGGSNNGGNNNNNGGNDNGQDQPGATTAPQGSNTQNNVPTPAPSATGSSDEGGCGSSIGGAALIAIAVTTVGVGISFKKKD